MTASVDVATGQRPEDERLSVGASFAYGLQHVLTMYGGIIAVPLIIGHAAGLDAVHIALLVAAGLFIGGLATMLQSWGLPFFGSQLPLVQGVSFAGVSTMLAIMGTGDLADATPEAKLQAVFGAVIAASVIGLIVAPFFAKIVKYFPPVVTGTVITVIGLSLMRVAAEWAMGGAGLKGTPEYGAMSNIVLAAITLAIVLVLSKIGVGMISRLSILLGIVVGTIVAIPFGKVDFSGIADAGVVAFPTPFFFGVPTFAVGAIVSMFVVILVTMVETTADILAVGEIVETKIDSKRIAAGLRADMLSSAVSPVFNSFIQSAFAQNVGLVAITRVKSRFVVVAAGVILVILGLLPVVGGIVAVIPPPVLGGAGVVLFGSVAAAGIRTLGTVKYDGNMNLIIVAVGVAVGVLPEVAEGFYAQFPTAVQIIFGSGISSAAIFTVVMNLLFNHLRAGTPENPSVFAAGTGRVITEKQFRRLQEGDYVEGGQLHRSDGAVVPVVTKEQAIAVTEAVDAGEIICEEDVAKVLGPAALPADVPRWSGAGTWAGHTVSVRGLRVRVSAPPAQSARSSSAISPAILCSTGTARSPNSGVTRASGPEMDSAVGVGAPSTGTAKQRTPISCSPSSIAYPRSRIRSSSVSRSGTVPMDFDVAGGMPARVTMSSTAVSGSWARMALPTPVEWVNTRRPTSVNIRIEWLDEACAT